MIYVSAWIYSNLIFFWKSDSFLQRGAGSVRPSLAQRLEADVNCSLARSLPSNNSKEEMEKYHFNLVSRIQVTDKQSESDETE